MQFIKAEADVRRRLYLDERAKYDSETERDKLVEHRAEDVKTRRLEEKEPTGIFSMIGKLLGIKHVKSLAGLLGRICTYMGQIFKPRNEMAP